MLRVDSPGGSAVASEVIWREVVRLREAGKPVVVSMGDVAASGGYYIACPADVILALPATITGSIGVFGGKFVVTRAAGAARPDHRDRPAGRAGPDVLRPAAVRRRRSGSGWPPPSTRCTPTSWPRSPPGRRPLGRGHRGGRPRPGVDRAGRAWRSGWSTSSAGCGRPSPRRVRGVGLPDDAPVQPAGHVPMLARLGRPRNSEDPRALLQSSLAGADRPAGRPRCTGRPGAADARDPPALRRPLVPRPAGCCG